MDRGSESPRQIVNEGAASSESTRGAKSLRFADVFAGLGGFHVALSRLGHRCVFASEIDEELRAVYQRNFGLLPVGDIREIRASDLPPHDILCAGFPCQPFSLAGKKKGTECPESGKLIDDVFRLIQEHEPRHVFLENVPNIMTIAEGRFWSSINSRFSKLGYVLEQRTYSPIEFGVPQPRLRLFMVARKRGVPGFQWPEPSEEKVRPLSEYVQADGGPYRLLEPPKFRAIEKWEQIVTRFKDSLRSHAVLASEFGADYPVTGLKPGRPWRAFRGAFGSPLSKADSFDEAVQMLPHYAVAKAGVIAKWQLPDVNYSRWLYAQAPEFFDDWKHGVENFHNSWQKLEWRGDKLQPSLWVLPPTEN